MEELKILLETKTKEKLEFNKRLLTFHLKDVVNHSMICLLYTSDAADED